MSGAEELDTGNFPTTQTPLVVQPTVDANNAVIFQTPALCPGWTKEKKTGDYLHKKKAKSSAKWPSETNLVASAARFSRFSTTFPPSTRRSSERDENQNQKKKRNEQTSRMKIIMDVIYGISSSCVASIGYTLVDFFFIFAKFV